MYQSLILDYLTHYQPEQKAELEQAGMLQSYLDEQTDAMQTARRTLTAQMATAEPQLSVFQREIEAEQQVRELFLPLVSSSPPYCQS